MERLHKYLSHLGGNYTNSETKSDFDRLTRVVSINKNPTLFAHKQKPRRLINLLSAPDYSSVAPSLLLEDRSFDQMTKTDRLLELLKRSKVENGINLAAISQL